MRRSLCILLLLFAWIFVGLPISIAKKAANQKKQVRPVRPAAPASRSLPDDANLA